MEQEGPEPPVPEALPAAQPPSAYPGLVVGSAALISALLFLPWVARIPYGGLALNAALGWGAYGVLLHRERLLRAAGNWAIVALLGFLATPHLTRVVAHQLGTRLPLGLDYTLAFLVLAVASGVGLLQALARWMGPKRGAMGAALAGAVASGSLAAIAALTSSTLTREGLLLVGLALLVTAAAVAVQGFVARRLPWAAPRVLASGPALAVSATQLLDGVVTYLAVVDPLGLAPGEFHEQVPLSGLVLATTGVGYPLLKWCLAMAIAFAFERHTWSLASRRVGLYLLILALGLGPALYSALQTL